MFRAYYDIYRPFPVDPVLLQNYDASVYGAYFLLDELTQYVNLSDENKAHIRQLGGLVQVIWVLRQFPNPHYINILLGRLGP